MAYGLRIINDSAELLIDSDYVNPTFVQKVEFNTTATFTEAGPMSSQVHPGYIRRDYSTPAVSLGSGSYIVLWALPDVGANDIYYHFPTSVSTLNVSLTCSVYANSEGTPLNYTLPTAYIFTTDAAGVNSMTSTDAALRMYSSTGVKTFDSNFAQLVPYAISTNFTMPQGYSPTLIGFPQSPTNPIYLLPKAAILFAGDNGFGYSSQKSFDAVYRRKYNQIEAFQMATSYLDGQPAIGTSIATFFAGGSGYLNIISADADLYQAAAPGTSGGTNPTYTLSSTIASDQSVSEGASMSITLTTTLVANGTAVPYTVTGTGIALADLSVGSLTGSFVIQNNTATANFTFANDLVTEGTEVFTLTLNGMTTSISRNIADTSRAGYAFAAPSTTTIGELFNEVTVDFNAVSTSGNVIAFAIAAPTSGNAAVSPSGWSFANNDSDINLTWTQTSTTTTVKATIIPDFKVEGTEYFRISATIGGNTYYSQDIAITDSSTSSITSSSSWAEITSNNVVTINVIGAITFNTKYSGDPALKFYLTSSNTSAITLQSGYTNNWTPDSDNYSASTRYVANSVDSDTTVTLYLRRNSATGPVIAQKDIVITNAAGAFSWDSTPLSVNEGVTSSLVFNYSNAANKTITFAIVAPTSGLANGSGAGDVTLNTTSQAVGNTNAAGTVAVNYYTAADVTTDGTKYFRLQATVNGAAYTSSDITVSDTSKAPAYSLTINSTWPENSSGNSIGISATNANGVTLYLTSSNTSLASIQFPYADTFAVNSDNYSVSVGYTTQPVTSNTNVTIYLRTGSATGTIVAQQTVTVTNEASTYTLGYTWTSQANALTNTFTLTVGNPVTGTTVSVAASGAGASRVSLGTTSFTTSSTTTMYNISVTTNTPSATVAAQSVTITLSFSDGATSKAFTFTIDAYTVSAGAIWYAYDTTSAPLSWTVPAGVTSIRVAMSGGGGGGGNGGAIKGGGGAGQVKDFNYSVTPGQVLTITAGAGGAGNVAGSSSSISGGNGGTITALGGMYSGNPSGGASGASFSGGTGTTVVSGGGGGSSGAGAAGIVGEAGGDGGAGTTIVTNATYYLAGGGGGSIRQLGFSAGLGEAGGGMGASGGTSGAGNGTAATFYGSGGGGSINGGLGGAGFRGIVMWYG